MKTCTQLPEPVLTKFREIHGDRYDYRLSVYVTDKTKIKIICPSHGVFEQIPHAHKRGQRCPGCARDVNATDAASYIDRAKALHGDQYDYNFGDRVKIKTMEKVQILCRHHGPFMVRSEAHIRAKNPTGCPVCGRARSGMKGRARGFKTFVERSQQQFGVLYDYSRVDYKGAHIPVEIVCPKHGPFYQTPANHYSGHHCGHCAHENRPISHGEKTIAEWLDKNKIEYQREKTFEDLVNPETGYGLRYDFYIPGSKLLIEFDGEHHFEPIRGDVERLAKIQALDAIKNEYAEQSGMCLIRISDRARISTILSKHLG